MIRIQKQKGLVMEVLIPRNNRIYVQEDNAIHCFSVELDSWDKVIAKGGEPLFSIGMPTKESADKLMDDLYYGEYTGA